MVSLDTAAVCSSHMHKSVLSRHKSTFCGHFSLIESPIQSNS